MGIVRVSNLKLLSFLIICAIICCVLYQYLVSPTNGKLHPSADRSVSNSNNNVRAASVTENHLSDLENSVLFGKMNERRGGEEANDESDNDDEDVVNVAMIFTKAQGNSLLRQKFVKSLNSMVKLASCPLKLHLIGDQSSLLIARNIIIREGRRWLQSSIQIVPHDADEMAQRTEPIIGEMLKYFIYKPGAYYSDTLFFFSIVLHKIFPLDKIILLDVDIKFNSDILELHRHFERFSADNVIGIAREQQPVYRHVFHTFRKENPGTKVGEPPPDGLTGFNSAVLLLNLQQMRESSVYQTFLNTSVVASLVNKYQFQGHLGDQDFFTLVSLEQARLFYILPCSWNKQLCVWWKGHGYEDVFELYHHCADPVNILHGNCNTIIPEK